MSLPYDAKSTMHQVLKVQRGALVRKLDGLGEYDIRRPMTPTGTNLLGLVKHTGSVQLGYFGEVFGRREDFVVPWLADDVSEDADMWAAESESREEILEFFDRSSQHADATIETLPLDATGLVPWWSEDRRNVTLHRILVHVIAEFARHAGHADIIRETLDGATGNDNARPTEQDAAFWSDYTQRLEDAARGAAGRR
jgi:uncharacterized damage-inducible protein DinB